jgi:transposase
MVLLNAKLQTFYRKLIASGKAAKVAITAVMRKLIVTLNAMVRDKISWKEGV